MRRSQLEQIKDIVEYCVAVPKKYSWILGNCNLSVTMGDNLLQICRSNKLLKLAPTGYLTTEKGKSYMQKFYYLIQMVGQEVPEPFQFSASEKGEKKNGV